MNKATFIRSSVLSALLITFNASANWNVGVSHLTIKNDLLLPFSTTHNALAISGGFSHQLNHHIYLSTHSFIAINKESDQAIFSTSSQIDLSELYGQDMRIGYQLSDHFSAFAGIQYLKMEFDISTNRGVTSEASDSEFDLIIGVNYQPLNYLSIESSFANSDAGDILNIGLRYQF